MATYTFIVFEGDVFFGLWMKFVFIKVRKQFFMDLKSITSFRKIELYTKHTIAC